MKAAILLASLLLLAQSQAWALSLGLSPDPKEAAKKFESNHSGKPFRQYFILGKLEDDAKAYMIQADGTETPLEIQRKGPVAMVNYKTGWGDGPYHGINQVYVTQERKEGGKILVETAKFLNIHHNCAWGHDHKHDADRWHLDVSRETSLDVTILPLWDGNFHIKSHSGDKIRVILSNFGKPVINGKVTVTTQEGWTKSLATDEKGEAEFTLIRDYYTSEWNLLKPHKSGMLLVEASFEEGDKIHKTSLPWRYTLTSQDYSSELLGSGILAGGILASALGAFWLRRPKRRRYVD